MELNNVLTQDVVLAKRDEWLKAHEIVTKRLQEIANETVELQKKALALDGAVQSCNIFLQIMEIPTPMDSSEKK